MTTIIKLHEVLIMRSTNKNMALINIISCTNTTTATARAGVKMTLRLSRGLRCSAETRKTEKSMVAGSKRMLSRSQEVRKWLERGNRELLKPDSVAKRNWVLMTLCGNWLVGMVVRMVQMQVLVEGTWMRLR